CREVLPGFISRRPCCDYPQAKACPAGKTMTNRLICGDAVTVDELKAMVADYCRARDFGDPNAAAAHHSHVGRLCQDGRSFPRTAVPSMKARGIQGPWDASAKELRMIERQMKEEDNAERAMEISG